MSDFIPTSKLERGRVVAGAVLNAGGKHLRHFSKRPFMSADKRKQDKIQLEDETAQLAFEALSKLRGTAIKIAQMISMDTGLVPEPIRRELSKSYHQIPPLGRVLVRKLLLEEFGNPAEQLFSQFNTTAFAAASLGQVHSAQDAKGNKLAVKLQYPGIDVTIQSDLQIARSLLRKTKQANMYLSSLDEIGARLKEEIDYRLEAKNTNWFRENLQVEGVVIPKTYLSLSSKRVLTTQHLRGLHLDEWLETHPSQARRNRAAQLIYNSFVKSFYVLHALHADPNPGNYLFIQATGADQVSTDSPQLGLIDFGCVRHFSPAFVAKMPKLLHAFREQDGPAVLALYQQLGMHPHLSEQSLNTFCHDVLLPFGKWVSAPFSQASFDFGQTPSYSSQGVAHLQAMSKVTGFDSIAKEFIFYTRTYTGLYQLMERIGAVVQTQHQWLDLNHLEKKNLK